MELFDVVTRVPNPPPWSEGDNIPWSEPAFSARMLREHLSQAHDAASRRTDKIEKHVAWIQRAWLPAHPSRILDLACGPGLYTSRLARLGHACVGIDYGPAAIAYAQETARRERLDCLYRLQDLRQADFGGGFDLAMFIFGEFNVFAPEDAAAILRRAYAALADGGRLVLEPHTFAAVRKIGEEGRSWYSAEAGLFSDRPHVCLQENCWDDARRVATTRYFLVDARTRTVTRYAASYQAYRDDEYRARLAECGFREVEFYPSLAGFESPSPGLFAIAARR